MKKVCVIFGGASSEHDVSLRSATSVLENIDREKYEIIMVGITRQGRWYHYTGPIELIKDSRWESSSFLEEAIFSPDPSVRGLLVFDEITTSSIKVRRKILGGAQSCTKNGPYGSKIVPVDIVFPVLHGKNGEDGTIQGLFELAKMPYVGCGVLASAVCMDKEISHNLLVYADVPKTEMVAVKHNDMIDISALINKLEEKIGYPMFVKPANAGSSVGVSKVKTQQEIISALDKAFEHDTKVVVEKAVVGREIECAVLGNENPEASMVLGEIVPQREFYDYEGKYIDDTTGLIAPAQLPQETTDLIIKTALKAYGVLGCAGLSRVDFFVKEDGSIILNEINTLPGFTSISMYPRLFAEDGMPMKQLITNLIEDGFNNWGCI